MFIFWSVLTALLGAIAGMYCLLFGFVLFAPDMRYEDSLPSLLIAALLSGIGGATIPFFIHQWRASKPKKG